MNETRREIVESLDGETVGVVNLDLGTGKSSEIVVELAECVSFLFDYLLPAYRRMGEVRKAHAVIMGRGRPISFKYLRREQSNGWECRDWTITLLFKVPEEKKDEVRHKIIGAYRLWGVTKFEVTATDDLRGFYEVTLTELERVRGLV